MTDPVVCARGLCKSYGKFKAVDKVSFAVYAGEIFGLLGPNGAGKTSTIRILMDIFRADSGEVELLGGPPARSRERVGYLPEERGLYQDQRVLDVLVYLAKLKGMKAEEAKEGAMRWLERVELQGWEGKRVKELSRGMQQKAQFAACLIHDPDLLILDEPFQGLDPVNVELFKRHMRALAGAGKAIVLSAHQMNLVEELCDRILLIDGGRAVLYGGLDRIKSEFAGNTVRVTARNLPRDLPGVAGCEWNGHTATLTLDGIGPQELLRALVERDVEVERFERMAVSLNDIFVATVTGRQEAG